jgi:tripartite-type tricarboxylate transporter receptor subunit TctC
MPYWRSGTVKFYAVLGQTRWRAAPDVSTIDEAGVPGLHIALWHGLWAPRNTPREVIGRLNAAVVDALADPLVLQRCLDLGFDLPTRAQQTPEALGSLCRAEIGRWWPIIRVAGINANLS